MIFELTIARNNKGNPFMLRPKLFRRNHLKHSFSARIEQVWNGVPVEINRRALFSPETQMFLEKTFSLVIENNSFILNVICDQSTPLEYFSLLYEWLLSNLADIQLNLLIFITIKFRH